MNPRSLLLSLLLPLAACTTADQAMESLPSGSSAIIGEARAAFYPGHPGSSTPGKILEYGSRVTVVEPDPLYTLVERADGARGYVSTFDLVPQGG